LVVFCALTALVGSAVPALAQSPVTISGGVDVVNRYMFRGIRQNSEGVAIWPAVDVAFTPFRGDGGLKSTTINVGTWNSLHTDPSNWYESDLYAAFTLGFSKAALTTTYTSYTSPDDLFTHVKEIMFRVSVDDSGASNLKPYVAVAFELDTDVAVGQADGGAEAGTYMELGVAPSFPLGRLSLGVPTKVGLSLNNYYENPLTGDDSKYGYFSIAGILSVPLGAPDTPGAHWSLRGGVEVQHLGDTTKLFNGGDSGRVIGSIGVGFAY
jgi:hypothetical protein